MLTTKGWLYLLICFLLLGLSIFLNKVEFYISFVILISYFIVSIINVGVDPMRFEVRRYGDQSYFFEGDSMEVNVRVKRGKWLTSMSMQLIAADREPMSTISI